MTTPTTAEPPVPICSCIEYWPGDGHAPDCPVLREILDARATIARLEGEQRALHATVFEAAEALGMPFDDEDTRTLKERAELRMKELHDFDAERERQQQRADAAERRVDDMTPLARLGEWALERIRGVYAGDVDAFDVQDKATQFGVIAPQSAPRPCGECCVCEEMDADVCHRDTDATTRARTALAALAAASGAADGAATTEG